MSTLRERIDSNIDVILRRGTETFDNIYEAIEHLKTLFSEVESEGNRLYVLASNNRVYSYYILKNSSYNEISLAYPDETNI